MGSVTQILVWLFAITLAALLLGSTFLERRQRLVGMLREHVRRHARRNSLENTEPVAEAPPEP